MSDLEKQYEANVGKPPDNLSDDHPYKWQWDYRGTKAERDALAETLEIPDEDDPPVVIEGQEELFS